MDGLITADRDRSASARRQNLEKQRIPGNCRASRRYAGAFSARLPQQTHRTCQQNVQQRSRAMPDFLTRRHGTWHFVRRVPFLPVDRRRIIKHPTKIRIVDDRSGRRASRVAEKPLFDWAGKTQGVCITSSEAHGVDWRQSVRDTRPADRPNPRSPTAHRSSNRRRDARRCHRAPVRGGRPRRRHATAAGR